MSALKPKLGDMIEIFRTGYQHWAVYSGKGKVVHLTPRISTSSMSASTEKAIVKEEDLLKVVGMSKYTINNRLDPRLQPRSPDIIEREAKALVGKEMPYSVFGKNCEHFATVLRYGKAESGQAEDATEAGIRGGLVAAAMAIGMAADSLQKDSDSEKMD